MSPEYRQAVRGVGIVLIVAAILFGTSMFTMWRDWLQAAGGVPGFVGCVTLLLITGAVGAMAAKWAGPGRK